MNASFPAHTHLDVINPLLGDLETATTAGRRYVMGKLLTQLSDAAAAAEHRLPDVQRRRIRDTLALLVREGERLLPDVETFARGARLLAGKLARA